MAHGEKTPGKARVTVHRVTIGGRRVRVCVCVCEEGKARGRTRERERVDGDVRR